VAGLGEPRPQIVGVFIDESPEAVAAVADLVGLDRVQLHGSEPPGYRAPRPPIKALKVRDGVVPDAEGWPDPVLLDSWTADQRGGTGRAWDWDLARPLLAARQVIVAGGLNPGNVGRLVERYRPYGVDVSSGVESRPRVKDPALMRAFVAAVREADGR
jgi:phosphoribosylanthranilate isomerase